MLIYIRKNVERVQQKYVMCLNELLNVYKKDHVLGMKRPRKLMKTKKEPRKPVKNQ